MPTEPSPKTQRLLNLAVGKSCVISGDVRPLLRTIRKRNPEARYSSKSVDGSFVVTRVA